MVSIRINRFYFSSSGPAKWSFIPMIALLALLASTGSIAGSHAVKEPTFEADTLNKPQMVRAERDGALHLNAENGKGVGPKIEYMPEWKAFGWFTAEDKVEWEVRVPKGGAYDVYLTWSVSDKEAGKPFVFQASEKTLEGTVRSTGSWEKFETLKIGTLQLSRGKQKMIFKPKTSFGKGGALLDLRQVKLVPLK